MSDVGQEGEHEVEMLLNRRTVRGVMRYLVRRRAAAGGGAGALPGEGGGVRRCRPAPRAPATGRAR